MFTAATQRELGTIDLAKLDRRPAPRILILKRADPAEAPLADRLRELGATVQEAAFTGYASLMRDVNFVVAPDQAFGLVRDWMAAGATRPRARTGHRPQSVRLSMPEAVEEPVFLGDEARLFGVVCRPTSPSADLPAVIFINTGANHHVGPNRMTVGIARRLAALGVTSLRIDVAGIGESPAPPGQPDHRLYALETCEDVRAALDWLEAQGHRRVVAIGLCCGAYIAFYTALRDSRIDGPRDGEPPALPLARGRHTRGQPATLVPVEPVLCGHGAATGHLAPRCFAATSMREASPRPWCGACASA